MGEGRRRSPTVEEDVGRLRLEVGWASERMGQLQAKYWEVLQRVVVLEREFAKDRAGLGTWNGEGQGRIAAVQEEGVEREVRFSHELRVFRDRGLWGRVRWLVWGE